MKKDITTLFLDIGGVLLTNGWDHLARKRAATNFKLEWEWAEMEDRHGLNFATYEEGIFRLALDIAQVPTKQIIYIENTLMFAQIAEGLGIRSILHTDYPSTCAQLASFGLRHDEGVSDEIR
jgi:hypothetical protein